MEFSKTVARKPTTAQGAESVRRRWAAGIVGALLALLLFLVLAPSVRADVTTATPQVVSLSYSPSSADVTNGSAQVTFTAHLTDSSDIQYASMNLRSQTTPSQSVLASFSRVSGTAQDGIWKATVNLPQGAAAGAWDYAGSIQDAVNFVSFNQSSYGNQNLPTGAPGPLTVADSSPSTPPQVVSLSYSPSSADVTNGSAQVTFTAHLTDSSDIQYASMNLRSQTTPSQSVLASFSRVSGTAQDGIWKATVNLPQGAAAGAWDYAGSIQDAVNFLSFNESSYGNQNLPTDAPGPLTVADSSPSTPPQVVSLSYSPSSADVTNGSAQVTFTAHLTDSSDIQYASMNLRSQTTPSQSVLASFSRVSGTAQDGIWKATVNLPQGAAAGAWDYAGSIQDAVNFLSFNESSYGNQNLPTDAPGPLTVTSGQAPTPLTSGVPTISGSAVDGQTLSESHASWSGSPTSYSYQWQSCDGSGNNCSPIPGATGQSYTLITGEVGHTIRVQETATNAGGSSDPAVSAATTIVLPQVPSTSGVPTISGSAVDGQTLSESHASWSGSPTSYSYQWQSCDGSGNNCSPIPGATGQSYTLITGEVGHTIRVQETATNAGGSSDPAVSAATTAVQPPYSDGRGTAGGGGDGTGGTGGTVGSSASGTSVRTSGSGNSGTGGDTSSPGGSGTGAGSSNSGSGGSAKAFSTFGPVKTSAAGASLLVACRGSSGSHCKFVLRVTAGGGKLLGSRTVRLAAGHRETVMIRLNGTAKRLLNQQHKLKAKLTVIEKGTAIARRVITLHGSQNHH